MSESEASDRVSVLPFPKAILFDLDGTPIAAGSVKNFAASFVKRYGAVLPGVTEESLFDDLGRVDVRAYRRGATLHAELVESLPWTQAPPCEELEAFFNEAFPPEVVLEPDSKTVLEAIRRRGVRTGIVTNGGPTLQRTKVQLTELDRSVDFVVVSGEVGVHKPDPRIFKAARELAACDYSDMWFVGDDPRNDVLGPQALGMVGIWKPIGEAAWPGDKYAGQPSATIHRLGELLAHLDR